MNPPAITIDARLRALRRLRPASRLAALIEAVPLASAEERSWLAPELLEMALQPDSGRAGVASLDALAAIVALWPNLDGESRRAGAAVGRGRWLEAIARAEPGSRLRERIDASLPGVASDLLEPALIRPMGELLGPERPGARSAERAILSIVRAALPADVRRTLGSFAPDFALVEREDSGISTGTDGPDVEMLVRDLGELAWGFPQHRSRPTLLAALLLAVGLRGATRRGDGGASGRDRLDRLLGQSTHPSSAALRGVLRWSRSPASRALAVRALATPAVAKAARDRLGRAESVEDHTAAAGLSHLLLHPGRRRVLDDVPIARKAVRKLEDEAPLPNARVQRSMPAQARRGVPRLVDAFGPSDSIRRGTLGPMLADADDAVRLEAMRRETGAFLSDYCFDRHPAIAGLAASRKSRVGTPRAPGRADEPGLWHRLRRSPHAGVRRIAGDETRALEPWDPGCAASRLLARRRLQQGGEAFVAEVRRRIVGGPVHDRLDAIMQARRIGLAVRIAPELIRLVRTPSAAGSDEAKICATACATLGGVPTGEAVRALNFCLAHADDRVRANAVDALHAQRRRGSPAAPPATAFIELKSDAHHRVRAGAVRALLETEDGSLEGEASRSLVALLGDVRPPHRDSGLWALERLLRSGREGPMRPIESAVTDLLERLGSDAAGGSLTGPSMARLERCRDAARSGLRERWGRALGGPQSADHAGASPEGLVADTGGGSPAGGKGVH